MTKLKRRNSRRNYRRNSRKTLRKRNSRRDSRKSLRKRNSRGKSKKKSLRKRKSRKIKSTKEILYGGMIRKTPPGTPPRTPPVTQPPSPELPPTKTADEMIWKKAKTSLEMCAAEEPAAELLNPLNYPFDLEDESFEWDSYTQCVECCDISNIPPDLGPMESTMDFKEMVPNKTKEYLKGVHYGPGKGYMFYHLKDSNVLRNLLLEQLERKHVILLKDGTELLPCYNNLEVKVLIDILKKNDNISDKNAMDIIRKIQKDENIEVTTNQNFLLPCFHLAEDGQIPIMVPLRCILVPITSEPDKSEKLAIKTISDEIKRLGMETITVLIIDAQNKYHYINGVKDIQKINGTPKGDFKLVRDELPHVIVSHKKSAGSFSPKEFVQWGGLTQIQNHPEIQKFQCKLKLIHALLSFEQKSDTPIDFPLGLTLSQEIVDDEIKNIAIYGIEYTYDNSNDNCVDFIIHGIPEQHTLTLETPPPPDNIQHSVRFQYNDSLEPVYKLNGTVDELKQHHVLSREFCYFGNKNGILGSGTSFPSSNENNLEPILVARRGDKGRNTAGWHLCRGSTYPKGGRIHIPIDNKLKELMNNFEANKTNITKTKSLAKKIGNSLKKKCQETIDFMKNVTGESAENVGYDKFIEEILQNCIGEKSETTKDDDYPDNMYESD